MIRKSFLYVFLGLMTVAPNTFAAQSEIFAKFYLPESVKTLDKTAWDNAYKQMLENLPNDKFAPGRILFKAKGSSGVFSWSFDPQADMKRMLDYVKNMPNVEYSQPDYIYTLNPMKVSLADEAVAATDTSSSATEQNQPNDPLYSQQVHLKLAGMERLFQEYGLGLERLIPKGHDPYIHIVDTGGGCEHPDLNRANIILKKDYVDWDDDPCTSPNGMNSHGEFVAAIMGATSNNNYGGAGIIPPNTKLVIWRVLDKDGSAFTSTIALALADIVIESAGLGNEIVNMSFGGIYEDPFLKSFILTGSATQEFGGKNITFISSSGNNGDQAPFYPAALADVLSIGANEFPLIETGEILRAGYSSFGKVDITAPVGGLDQDNDQNGAPDAIFVEGRTYDKDGKNPTPYRAHLFWGTSGAAPIASGVAASLINMGIYGPGAIRKILTETTNDIPPLGFDQETGWGMVRADTAVMSVDDSLPEFGSFSQNSYVCTVALGENSCEITINYSFRTTGHKIYLWDNYSNSLRDLGNNGLNDSATITVRSGEKTYVMLLYYPNGGVNPAGNPWVLALTAVTGRALLLPPKGSLSGKNCTLALGGSSCSSTITYAVLSNGWNVYIWDNVSDSWSNTAINGSGTKTATVKSSGTTFVRLYYCPGNNGTPGNCLGKVDLPTGIDLNANPTPPPTAYLSANRSFDITVNVGDTINYLWFSGNADGAGSTYTSTCGSGPWVADNSLDITSAVVMPFQAGCSYIISYFVTQSSTGRTASAAITVRVR